MTIASSSGTALLHGAVSIGQELPPLDYDVSATTVVLGALAARDWRPMHHDHDFAVNRQGTKDIFLNTPNLAAWFERYITDWSGPLGRVGRMTFRMRDSIYPDDTMSFRGRVTAVETDDTGCGWVELDVSVTVGERVCTLCQARLALPVDHNDNPWQRRGDQWTP